MQIKREHSRLSFRRRPTWSGCLPFLLAVGLLVGIGVLSRNLFGQWLLSLLQPQAARIGFSDAQAAFAQGDLDTAIDYGRALVDADAFNKDALILLARALIYRSYVDYNREVDRSRALDLTVKARDDLPTDFDILAIHAFVQQANGLSEAAAENALRVIRRNSDNIIARLALALSYGSRGLFEVALREGQRAVEIAQTSAPDWQSDAYRVLAIAYSDLGQYQQAARASEQAIQHNRRLVPLHFERALYAVQVGDTDTATASYFNVIAFDEDNVKARFRLCEVSSTLREPEAALTYCTEVTDRAPGWAEGWYQLGLEYFLQGEFRSAQQALNRCSALQVAQAVSITQRRFECWYIQGQAAEILGDCPELLRLYAEYQAMASATNLSETWTYPPEGPPGCHTPQAELDG